MRHELNIHSLQKTQLHLSPRFYQSLKLLQMSQIQLNQLVQEEIEKNPLLEEVSSTIASYTFPECRSEETLYACLTQQIQESFAFEREKEIAHIFLNTLDEKGFLSSSFAEICYQHALCPQKAKRVLETLQTFHPPGIFAASLQEALLLQLKSQGNSNTEAFQIVEHHFSELITKQYKIIQKKLQIKDFKKAIHLLSKLRFRPAECFINEPTPAIYPDFILHADEEEWSLSLNEAHFPHLALRSEYKSLSLDTLEEKRVFQEWLSSAKWLIYALKKRRSLLLKIVFFILKRQKNYLLEDKPLKPLKLQDAAKQLQLHLSTISRAILDKYIETPRGIIPIRSLFTISEEKDTLLDLLKQIISEEDKNTPLTDEQIANNLKDKGVLIARRTVAKYRKTLKISDTKTRKILKTN